MNPNRSIEGQVVLWSLVLARWLLPASHKVWADAMRGEIESGVLRRDEKLKWARGCLVGAARMRIQQLGQTYIFAASTLLVALLYVEWHTDEATVVLTLLIGIATMLGFCWPRRAWWTGMLVGEWLLLAHGFTTITGWWWPFYQCGPLSWEDWMIDASLAVPSVLGAAAGKALRARFVSEEPDTR